MAVGVPVHSLDFVKLGALLTIIIWSKELVSIFGIIFVWLVLLKIAYMNLVG